jgi:HPt (histidine-containing phosphotransfer) domain-containing protein
MVMNMKKTTTIDDQLPVWDQQKMEYRMMNDESLIRDMIEDCLTSAPVRIRKIKDCIKKNDMAGISHYAHSLIGLVAQMSGERVRAVAKSIELCTIAKSDLEPIRGLVEELESEFAQFRDALRARNSVISSQRD